MTTDEHSSKVTSVRLSEPERAAILKAVTETCSQKKLNWHEIRLFGSRTSLAAKGGDIDFHVVLAADTQITDAQKKSLAFAIRENFCDQVGEQKVDMIVSILNETTLPFLKIIEKKEVCLWKNHLN